MRVGIHGKTDLADLLCATVRFSELLVPPVMSDREQPRYQPVAIPMLPDRGITPKCQRKGSLSDTMAVPFVTTLAFTRDSLNIHTFLK